MKMTENQKVILWRVCAMLLVFSLFVGCPIAFAVTVTRMLEKSHIKEIQQYDQWYTHVAYAKTYNFCPNCGEDLRNLQNNVED